MKHRIQPIWAIFMQAGRKVLYCGMRHIIALLLALVTACCSGAQLPTDDGWFGPGRIPLHIHPTLELAKPAMAQALHEAAQELCDLGFRPCIEVHRFSRGRHQANLTTRIDDDAEPWEGCTAGLVACVRSHAATKWIWFSPDWEYLRQDEKCDSSEPHRRAQAVARHELLHFLGYDHVCGKGSGGVKCTSEHKKFILYGEGLMCRNPSVWPEVQILDGILSHPR